MKLAKRAMALKPSPTLALAAKAKELVAKGQDVISLSLGEPDWDTFDFVKEAAILSLKKGQTKYTPANGIPELRKAIAKQTAEQIGIQYDPNDVTVSAGAKFIVFAAIQVLIESGDEVIIPAPYWVSYPTMVELADGVPVPVLCGPEQSFKLRAEQLKKAITPKTKLLLLNSPSNPTGDVYTHEELSALAGVLRQNPQVAVLSDDIYNRLFFSEENVSPHLLQVAPDLKDRVIVVNGASKSYAMTGWRIGWALGPSAVIGAMTKYQSQSVSNATTFCQYASVDAIEKSDGEIAKVRRQLRQRRDLAFELLKSIPGIEVSSPTGAFYIWPSIKSYFGKSIKGRKIIGSREFAEILLEDFKVAAVPGVEFGLDGYLRISYVLEEARMREAIGRLQAMIKELS